VVDSLADSETLVIDSGLVTAKVAGGTEEMLRNGLPFLSELNFPALHKGTNTITVTVQCSTFTELEIQVKSRRR
jgi:hypothetical protein